MTQRFIRHVRDSCLPQGASSHIFSITTNYHSHTYRSIEFEQMPLWKSAAVSVASTFSESRQKAFLQLRIGLNPRQVFSGTAWTETASLSCLRTSEESTFLIRTTLRHWQTASATHGVCFRETEVNKSVWEQIFASVCVCVCVLLQRATAAAWLLPGRRWKMSDGAASLNTENSCKPTVLLVWGEEWGGGRREMVSI